MNYIKVILIYCLAASSHSKSVDKFYESIYKAPTSLNNPISQSSQSTTLPSSLSYIKASIPSKIFNCMSKFNILRCMKIFILQQMETNKLLQNHKSSNITGHLLNKILFEKKDSTIVNEIDDIYLMLSEKELNRRLYISFKRFFNNREIKMHFIPGMIVKVVPSKKNLIDMSLKKELIESSSGSRAKNKNYKYLLKLGLPAFLLPIALMGSFLPMMLPAIKTAAIFSGALNNAALIGALMYLARTVALENEQKNTIYYSSGTFHSEDYGHTPMVH